MSFQKSRDLSTLIDQYVNACNEINNSISNIKDEKTFQQLRTHFDTLITNTKKIDEGLKTCTDPNVDELQERYNQACQLFEADKNYWESTIMKRVKEQKKALEQNQQEERMQNLSEEQRQIMQQNDELDYLGRQAQEVLQLSKELNELGNKINNKIVEDHVKVEKIDDTIETAKTEMQKGNDELEQAEKDQKKFNIC